MIQLLLCLINLSVYLIYRYTSVDPMLFCSANVWLKNTFPRLSRC